VACEALLVSQVTTVVDVEWYGSGRRRLAESMFVAAALILGACATMGVAAQSPYVASPSWAWSNWNGGTDATQPVFSPDGSLIYVGGLWAVNVFNSTTGATVTTLQYNYSVVFPTPAVSPPTASTPALLFINANSTLYAYTADKSATFRFKFDAISTIISGSVSVRGSTVAFVNTDGVVFAVDIATGKLKWAWSVDDVSSVLDPVLGPRHAYVVAGSTLFAIDIDSGAQMWNATVPSSIGLAPALNEIASVIAVAYVQASRLLKIQAFDSASGAASWSYQSSFEVQAISHLLSSGEYVTASFTEYQTYVTFNASSGVVVWTESYTYNSQPTTLSADAASTWLFAYWNGYLMGFEQGSGYIDYSVWIDYNCGVFIPQTSQAVTRNGTRGRLVVGGCRSNNYENPTVIWAYYLPHKVSAITVKECADLQCSQGCKEVEYAAGCMPAVPNTPASSSSLWQMRTCVNDDSTLASVEVQGTSGAGSLLSLEYQYVGLCVINAGTNRSSMLVRCG
jgi:outer membrane protein assembly factor BamB